MCFEVGSINRDRLVVGDFGSQTYHDPRKGPHVAPPFPAVVECFVWTIFLRDITLA